MGAGYYTILISMVMALDFITERYPRHNPQLDVNATFTVGVFIGACGATMLISGVSLHRRILSSYIGIMAVLLYIILVETVWQPFSEQVSYPLLMATVFIGALFVAGETQA